MICECYKKSWCLNDVNKYYNSLFQIIIDNQLTLYLDIIKMI